MVASQLISKFRRPRCHQRWVSIFRAPRLPRRPNGFCVTSIDRDLDLSITVADGDEFAEFLAQLRFEIARSLGSPARVPTLPRAKLMLPGRSLVADGVGLFVFCHCDIPLSGCDLNTRAAPRWASRASAERFCSTDRKGSSLSGRGAAHFRSAMHKRREPTADAVLPCSVLTANPESAAASSALRSHPTRQRSSRGQS